MKIQQSLYIIKENKIVSSKSQKLQNVIKMEIRAGLWHKVPERLKLSAPLNQAWKH